ncbi:hypothetical protein PR048_020781 [Dryococelus australis]|uniref:Uncharacterized protein n=1 Tax=Dryococelus australis TaxID=614101 RepID=A0ABQ9GWF8_9NEOP|nr:hypothetical protein PR048_020781 [Dryococelus australis]
MKNETLVAQRMVYDSILVAGGDLSEYSISKSLLLSYRNARARLTEETEMRQKEAKGSKEDGEICRKHLAKEKSDWRPKKLKC